MDRRSWLWRRKSSDKSPSGETDSSISGSGSISSPSERFSDEHQASPNQTIQSPEVNSKSVPLPNEDVNDGMKILTEKLSEAIATISAKEELVKQHAKVAEEAVTGWEKAENEVATLKQELDSAIKKNSLLDDRVVHLDGALKECLRQLRQVREEQHEKIQEVISKNSQNSESKNSELERQLSDLREKLEAANSKVEKLSSSESELRLKLVSFEKENSSLRVELRSRLEELEIRTLERDLSTKTAETASKQHLESIKRVAKLEAEIRRLKSMARKVTTFNESKSISESQSDNKSEKASSNTNFPPSPEVKFMDDFLEMEKLAALPSNSIDKQKSVDSGSFKSELDSMINRTSELDEKIEIIESEKLGLVSELNHCQNKLKISEAQLNTCQNQLKISQAQLRESNKKLNMLQAELELANELRQAIDLELDDANVRREKAESRCNEIEDERENLLSNLGFLEREVEKERALYKEASMKCKGFEDEISILKHERDSWKSQFVSMKESKEELKQELLNSIAKKEEVESQLKDVKSEVKSLPAKIGSLEKEVKSERQMSLEFSAKCKTLENELSRMKREADIWQNRLALASESKDSVNEELQIIIAKKEEVESELKATLAKVNILENEVEKERKLSEEFASKYRKLDCELSKKKIEAEFQIPLICKEKLEKQQEKELTLAANKLAECQKTIASLGNQLKSLANLEDLFLESEKMLQVSVMPDKLSSETIHDTLNV